MGLATALPEVWRRRGPLAMLLWPLSLVFTALAALRRALYRAGLLKTERLPVPVIVVGNVVAGGAGKTPIVIELVRHLQARGLAPAVVSRGYGRQAADTALVRTDSRAADVGDEPLLVHRCTGAPVAVAPRRADAARLLLREHPATRVIVCDDGLQHLALARDMAICVFGEGGLGNGWRLPAGPLREAWPAPGMDFVLTHGQPPADAAAQPPSWLVGRRLSGTAVRGDGTEVPLAWLATRPVAALAGIARPAAFFDMLRAAGVPLARTDALPDHYDFDSYTAPSGADFELICTEKDAVKLWPRVPRALAVPLVIDLPPDFLSALDAKLSSVHGQQTA